MGAFTVPLTARAHPDLPIHSLTPGDGGDRAVLYAPGLIRLVAADRAKRVAAAFQTRSAPAEPEDRVLADLFETRGRSVVAAWRGLGTSPFAPECLTLYLGNQCDLACRYCYAAGAPSRRQAAPTLTERVVRDAARLVARHCADRALPLTVAFHGGGEPTLHWDLLAQLYAVAGDVAREHGVALRTYLATHGAITEPRARWLADHIDEIGISCDGPPDIQDAMRPGRNGRATSADVERTVGILRAAGRHVSIRVTVTPATAERLGPIVTYLIERLGATRLRVEPVYEGRRPTNGAFRPGEADAFAGHFAGAWGIARAKGADLCLSGVRLDELHGPYCNPLRNVLQVTPDGRFSACFLSTGDAERQDRFLDVGGFDRQAGAAGLDWIRSAVLRHEAARQPARCESCINAYHCARDCPDRCALDRDGAQPPGDDGFRCRVQRLLAPWLIWQRAAQEVH